MIFCFFPAVLTIQFSITIWELDVLWLEIMVYFFFLNKNRHMMRLIWCKLESESAVI